MTAVTAAAVHGRASARATLTREAIVTAGVGALLVGLAAGTWLTWGDVGRDTGYDLVAGARVAHGHLPYVDGIYYYGPLAPFALGLFDWVGGGGIAPAIALGLLLSTGIVFATYALARTLAGRVGAGFAAAVTAAVAFAPTNFSFVLPHTYSAPFGVLASLCFLLALSRRALGRGERWLAVAGTAAGLAALTRPEFAVAAAGAAVGWLVQRTRAGEGRREAALLLGPALALPAVVYGAFMTAVPPSRLLFDDLYPRAQLHAAGNAVLRLHAPLTPASFAELVLRLALYAAGAAVLVLASSLLDHRRRFRGVAAAAAASAGVVVAVGAVLRPETARYWLEFVYGWIPAGAAAALTIAVWRVTRGRRGGPLAGVELAGLALLTLLAAKDYGAFFFLSPRPQPAVYAAPLAAVFLARLHLVTLARSQHAFVLGAAWLAIVAGVCVGLTLKDAQAKSATVRGSGGALRTTPSDAAAYRAALRWIAAGSAPGDAVLVLPQDTALYSLSGRTDPVPQISLLPGALASLEDERAVIRRLERSRVRLAFVDSRPFPEYGHTTFGGSFDRALAAWLHRNFAHEATLGRPGGLNLDVWLRRSR